MKQINRHKNLYNVYSYVVFWCIVIKIYVMSMQKVSENGSYRYWCMYSLINYLRYAESLHLEFLWFSKYHCISEAGMHVAKESRCKTCREGERSGGR